MTDSTRIFLTNYHGRPVVVMVHRGSDGVRLQAQCPNDISNDVRSLLMGAANHVHDDRLVLSVLTLK